MKGPFYFSLCIDDSHVEQKGTWSSQMTPIDFLLVKIQGRN